MNEENWKLVKPYIWMNEVTLRYHFQDEAEQLSDDSYDTIENCELALQEYVKYLG